jgi:TolB protein
MTMHARLARTRLIPAIAVVLIAAAFVGAHQRAAEAATPGDPGRIAFVSARDGNFEIYSMEPDGSDVTNLTQTPNNEDDPVWSPSGTRLAFVRAQSHQDLWVMQADGSDALNLTPGPNAGDGQTGVDPTWAPDESRIAYVDNGEIWSVQPDGAERTNLTQTATAVGLESDPAWSPDGSTIAYVRGGDLWTMNDDGTGQAPLAQSPSIESSPDWSPDGNLLVFARGSEIWTIKPDGTGAKVMSAGVGKGGTDPAWSPNGERIVFASSGYTAQNGPDIFTMKLNGSGVTRVGGVADFIDTDPSWQSRVASADLAVAITDAPDPVRINTELTYTATVTNNGPADARLAAVSLIVPWGTTFGSAVPSQGSCRRTGVTVLCRIGALAAGSFAAVTVRVNPVTMFDVVLAATLSSSQGDPEASNDTARERTTVKPPPGPAAVARLTWTAPDRLRDSDGDGLIDEQRFNDPKAAATPFRLTLEACDSGPVGQIMRYTFRVTMPSGNVLSQSSSNCRFAFTPPREGVYPTRLTVEASDDRIDTIQVDVPFRDYFIVSLGDSVASGEGNPDKTSTNPEIWASNEVWQSQKCHRTARSGPSRAALDLERFDPTTSVTFVHLACSGAQITSGLLYHYGGIEPDGTLIPPQLSVLKQLMDQWNRKPDAVLITIGANDAEFAEAVLRCLLPDRCQNDPDFVAEVGRRLARLPARFDLLDQRLDALGIPPSKVFLTEYFDPTRDQNAQFTQCLPTLYPSEWQWAEANVVDKLNQRVQAAALLPRHGWNFIGGIAAGYQRHGYCSSSGWVVRLEHSFAFQGDQNGAFHPNDPGHALYGQQILEALRRVL